MATRRRVVRSSSQGEIGIFNQIRPIESPVAVFHKNHPAPPAAPKPVTKDLKAPVNREDRSHRCVFTLASPEREPSARSKNSKKPNEGFYEFLQACALCKKKLAEDKDVYMYGYLSAFCSPDCRDDQIALDGFDKEVSKESAKMQTFMKKCTPGRVF